MSFLAILVFLTLLGVFLTLTGLFPKRHGDTPYCHGCRYNLTGTDLHAEAARCPECGSWLLQPGAVVVGERRMRRARVALGITCLAVGVVPLGTALAGYLLSVEWYAYKPTGWVLSDIEGSDSALAAKAWREINRRVASGNLRPPHIARLAEIALAEQARPTPRQDLLDSALNALYALYAMGNLSEEHAQRFLAQLMRITLSVRERVVCDQEFVVNLSDRFYAPSGRFSLWYEPGQIRVDDEVFDWGCVHGGLLLSNSGLGTSGRYISVSHPGRHTLTLDFTTRVFAGTVSYNQSSKRVPLYEISRTLAAPLEVLAEEPPDLLRLVSTPELDEQVLGSLELYDFRVGDSFHEGRPPLSRVQGTVGWQGVRPVPLVFDVLLEIAGREIPIGSVSIPPEGKPTTVRSTYYSVNISGEANETLPESVNVILRSSRATALRETIFARIWSGELRFENVPLSPDDSTGFDFKAHRERYAGTLVQPTFRPADPSRENDP